MAQIIIKIPAALKRKMDAYQDIDWSKTAQEAFKDMLKRTAEAEKIVDKSSYLRTRLFRIPKPVTNAWGEFFSETPKKKAKRAKRKPF